jgi:hypothetical protein
MLLLSSSVKFIRKVAVAVLLPLLASSCQWITDDYDDSDFSNDASQYINIIISVSADNRPVTRGPQGGEYGDGTERGIDPRENKVNDITLIFYKDANGINTTSDEAKVMFLKKYDVHEVAPGEVPDHHIHKTNEPYSVRANEVLYTTGDQKLSETLLQAGETYKVLVVANADVNINVGDKIKTDENNIGVRDRLTGSFYNGTGLGVNATDFVMTSESDVSVALVNPTVKKDENKAIYYFDCIHIERLAARIDYCTKGATYAPDYNGYKYMVGSTGSFLVVTKVTPFNIYNEQEYLFKRVQDAWPASVTTYLGDETKTNYVVDPNSALKLNNETAISYVNPISALLASSTNSFAQVMADVHETSAISDDDGKSIIIAYPGENTLRPESLLKQYATGITFETKFYATASATPITRTYYHYLRHQGESATGSSYKATELTSTNVENDIATCGSLPMNYGIVRNNIYRVSIEGFSTIEGTITLKIEEEKWRHVDNPAIYI